MVVLLLMLRLSAAMLGGSASLIVDLNRSMSWSGHGYRLQLHHGERATLMPLLVLLETSRRILSLGLCLGATRSPPLALYRSPFCGAERLKRCGK